MLGLGIVLGARIYTRSQALLFSGNNLALKRVETGALVIGCTLMAAAHLQSGFSEIDLYPSRVALQASLSVFLVGGYLFLALGRPLARQSEEGAGTTFRVMLPVNLQEA
jgi:hypothetical protein